MFSLPLLGCSLAILSLIYAYARVQRSKQFPGGKDLPGPVGLPFLGSVLELPDLVFLKFHEWGQKYGPIYQVNLAGSCHVWISTDAIAKDILSKRSQISSDRPHIPALEQDNRDSGQYLPLMSKNVLWARQRKFAKQIMDTTSRAAFYGYPELEAVRLLHELMEQPDKYNHSLESFVARITCRLAWGTPRPSDELKQRARELLIGVSPNGALGNQLPLVMALPEKLSPAKAWESRRARTERKFFEIMRDRVAAAVRAGSSTQSWMRHFLDMRDRWGFDSDLEGAFAVGMHGIAGALTIAAPMQSFCLAMCHYPEFLPILHEELDRVCGDEMPTLARMPEMPVLRAFIRETLRWRPPVPTGIPHVLTQDDIYDGYILRKGTVIHPLEWSISRDPTLFPDPDAFNPMRWLDSKYPTYREPLSRYPSMTEYSQFGYGKRTCQGTAVTEADLFVGIGSLAWLFDMQLPGTNGTLSRKDSGVDLRDLKESTPEAPVEAAPPAKDPTLEYTPLLIAKPKPFRFELTVRNMHRASLVRDQFKTFSERGEFEDAECFWEGGTAGNAEFGWGKV